jgi:deazaflavin-dependent oxidoreductase (nitroreductase family)
MLIPLYRIRLLPLFGAGQILLLLKTKGRKPGNKRWTPLEYRRIKNEIIIFSGRGIKADWFKNLKEDPDSVRVLIGFHEFKPKIHIVAKKEEKIDLFKFYVCTHPWAAKTILGWDSKVDDPKSANFESLSEVIEVIKLQFTQAHL